MFHLTQVLKSKNICNFYYIYLLLLLSATLISCESVNDFDDNTNNIDSELETLLRDASNGKGLEYFKLPRDYYFKAIPQDPKNPLNLAKVKLGKFLYHETALAIEAVKKQGLGTYSCASCHHVNAGFAAGKKQGIGEGGLGFGEIGTLRKRDQDYSIEELDIQPIRSPTTLNTAWQEVMLWNGQFGATGINQGTENNWTEGTPKEVNYLGFEGLESQAIAGLKVHRLNDVKETIIPENPIYKQLFKQAFPTVSNDDLFTNRNVGLAIAAYERNLISNQAPFQKWLKGNLNAMNRIEKKGAKLFFGKAKCVTCHTGPALNSMKFYALGFPNLKGSQVFNPSSPNVGVNLGRGGFTGNIKDNYKFKTPQLYNLVDSPFYGHGSSFTSLRSVVEYKNKAIPSNEFVPAQQLAKEFKPLKLSDNEVDALVEFLRSALRDPNLGRYIPLKLPSGNCFPNNDPISRIEIGCNKEST